jgi:hypothetical protein
MSAPDSPAARDHRNDAIVQPLEAVVDVCHNAPVASIQDRPPNFRDEKGNLFLVRCFACWPEHGRENWAVVVATGTCAWCDWYERRDA